MSAQIQKLTFPGAITRRGFWLYVCRIESPVGELLYVGRTGDSSSSRATSPFTRIGLHLGTNKNQALIRKHLKEAKRKGGKQKIKPEDCTSFQMVAYGPMAPEAEGKNEHRKARDKVAALEKALAAALKDGGYDVLNEVHSRMPLDPGLWEKVHRQFAREFERIGPGPQAAPHQIPTEPDPIEETISPSSGSSS